jgi:hypothetical protein
MTSLQDKGGYISKSKVESNCSVHSFVQIIHANDVRDIEHCRTGESSKGGV